MTQRTFKGIGAQSGLSLIELIIALALGVVLTLGVAQIFLGSGQTYRLNDGIAVLQENMRFILGRLRSEGQMAGNAGCLVGPPTLQVDTTTPASLDPLIYGPFGVLGWEANGTGLDTDNNIIRAPGGGAWTNGITGVNGIGPNPALPVNPANVVPGNDVLVLNGAVLQPAVLVGNPVNPANTIGTAGNTNVPDETIVLVVSADCSTGDKFQKTNANNSNGFTKGNGGTPGNLNPASNQWSANYTPDASIYRYVSTAYYIGQSANPDDPRPALFRDQIDAGGPAGGAVEMINGVESMQVIYGVATVADPTEASVYVTADAITDWSLVVSVRIALLMSSEDRVVDEAAATTYNVAGARMTPAAADRRARLVGSTTVGVRRVLQ